MMTGRTIMATILLTACALGFFAASGWGQADEAQKRTRSKFKPVMSVHDLMEEQEHHFVQIVDLIKNSDAKNRFKKMRHSALALGEMANVNSYQKQADQDPEYRRLAEQLRQQSVELADLAAAKKIEEVKTLAGNINRTCTACHNKFEH